MLMTIVMANNPGLQILDKKKKRWVATKHQPLQTQETLLLLAQANHPLATAMVLGGPALEAASGGIYKSQVYRYTPVPNSSTHEVRGRTSRPMIMRFEARVRDGVKITRPGARINRTSAQGHQRPSSNATATHHRTP